MKTWICVYCGTEVPESIHPTQFVCCGEVGHTEEVDEQDDFNEYNDEMDGDAASALASAGWGTDEDYGCYSDCE